MSDGDSPCFNLHIINETDLIIQRRHGKIDIYSANEANWILNKSFNYKYCSFCRSIYVSNKYYKFLEDSTKILYYRSQLLPEKNAILVPLDSSAVGMLSLKTLNMELTLDPFKQSDSSQLGAVMAMKPLMNTLLLIAYEGGQLLLWDMRMNGVLSSLAVEQYPMTFDFDTSLMQGILGSASEKLEVLHKLIFIIFCI